MTRKRKILVLLGIPLLVCTVLFFIYILPAAKVVIADMQAYETRVGIRDDYTLHTTPLDKSVIEDICLKLGIQTSSEDCQPNAVVYAPDLFDEIKVYFRGLPDQEKTYVTVQDKLGSFQVFCEASSSEGHYRCQYDIRGDNAYSIFFRFDENNFYYEIMAPIGGS